MTVYYGNSGSGADPQFSYPNNDSFGGPVPVSPVKINAIILPTDNVPGQVPNTSGNNTIKWTSVPKLKGIAYGEVENGNSASTTTINWPIGARQSVVMATDTTFVFTAPEIGITVQLKITQDSSGGRTATWPASIKWAGGVSVLSVSPGAVDFATFYYDGTNYWGVLSKSFT